MVFLCTYECELTFPQVCSAGSRLLVQESVYDKVVNNLKTRLTHYRLGDSLDKAIDMGAIVDESQRKTIEEYVEDARKEGAEVDQATACIPSRGCYYPPTIITNVQTVSRVVAEEVGLCLPICNIAWLSRVASKPGFFQSQSKAFSNILESAFHIIAKPIQLSVDFYFTYKCNSALISKRICVYTLIVYQKNQFKATW
ncbi:MAG: aldehyde dehydrogenase family protein [Candidatus Thiodiazotropha sp.]